MVDSGRHGVSRGEKGQMIRNIDLYKYELFRIIGITHIYIR